MEKKTRSTIRLIKELDQHHARLLLSPKWTETTCMLTKIAGSPSFPTYVQERQRSRNNCQCGIAILFSLQPQKREKLVVNKTDYVKQKPYRTKNKGLTAPWEAITSPLPKYETCSYLKCQSPFPLFWEKVCARRDRGTAQICLVWETDQLTGGREKKEGKQSPSPWPKHNKVLQHQG